MSITYSNNTEYRQVIRTFCDMSCNTINNIYLDSDIDEESYDELLYDPKSIESKMNEIFKKTKDDSLWIHLYELAVAKFLSTNIELGVAVLFSYDFFPGFYACWKSFTDEPEKWCNKNEYYNNLVSLL